ncbi:MAG: tetratricopeptide repeat protein [Candidatus Obscuribacterales bacterium]|nr:tetratricopeptide repeat protein [Candidatus Obscuribacterales bacterium]
MTGLGGIGKTQIATEFAYLHKTEFNVVCWIESTQPEAIESAFRRLAKALGVHEQTRDFGDVFDEVARCLDKLGCWLLIFNDARNVDAISQYVPNLNNGSILITSRNQDWSSFAKTISVPVFEKQEAVQFVLLRTNTNDHNDAIALVECLHSLPLALEQACAYIAKSNKTIESYINLFRVKRFDLFGDSPLDYDKTLRTTWEVSSGELEEESLEALQFISICSIFESTDIDLAWFQDDVHISPLAEVIKDEMALDKMIATLRSFSLIEVIGPGIFSVHALVQAVVRTSWSNEECLAFGNQALLTMGRTFLPLDIDNVNSWPLCSRLLPHVLSTLYYIAEIGMLNKGMAISLMVTAGQYLYIRGYYSLATPLLETAAEALKEIDDVPLESRSNCLNSLAVLYRELERYDEALPLAEEALKLRIEKFGEESQEVIVTLNNLSVIKQCTGDILEAESLFQKAVDIARRLCTDDKEDLLSPLANFANLYLETGQPEKGLPMIEESYKICEALQHEKPHLLAGAGGLMSSYYRGIGNLTRAIDCMKASLKAKIQVYGLQNSVAATAINNLGVLYNEAKMHRPARCLFALALKIRENIYPSNHSTIAESYGQLGATYLFLDWCTQAESAFKRSVEIYRTARSNKTAVREAVMLRNYALLLHKLNRHSEANRREDEASKLEGSSE